MNCRALAAIILTVLISEELSCQIDSIFNDGLYDTIIEESSDGINDSEMYNIIESCKNNPLNLNEVTLISLLQLPFVDYKTASAILRYRTMHDRFFSTSELFLIDELDKSIAEKIIPFFFVDNSLKAGAVLDNSGENGFTENFSLKLRSRIVNSGGNRENNNYSGSSLKQYNRMILNYDLYQFGITTEKDAGENNLFDFNSFHFAVKNKDKSNLLILGDYTAEFGQGLLLWDSYSASGTSEISSVIKNDRNILPYSGSNENKYFRGMACSFGNKRYSISSFISYKKMDAVMDPANTIIVSLPQDGNHRTESEISHADKGKELFYGGRIDYSADSVLSVGLLYCRSDFVPPLKLENMQEELKKIDAYSLAYKCFFRELFITGEVAGIRNKLSVNSSLYLNAGRKIQFVVSYRNYNNSLISAHSAIADENGCSPGDETGIFSGVKLNSIAGNLSIFYDQVRLPYKGNELLVYYRKDLSDGLDVSLRYKLRRKLEAGQNVFNNARAEIVYKINKGMILKSRFDYCTSSSDMAEARDEGFSFYQDLKMRIGELFILNGRITLYNSESFDVRLYEYENDIPGLVNNKILMGKGIKIYFLFKYQMNAMTGFSFKYHQDSRRLYGNPAAYADDNKISFQLDIRF